MGKQNENGSFHNPSQSSSKAQRRARQGAECTWASLKARKAPLVSYVRKRGSGYETTPTLTLRHGGRC